MRDLSRYSGSFRYHPPTRFDFKMIEGKIENPQISVVMSVFNGETFLESAIESVLNQTFSQFEFIIINDHSTDRTSEILKEFEAKDNRMLVFEKPINKGFKGFVENLNLGISKSRGKYIARMDADDLCLPDRLEKQWDYLEKNPDVFLVGSSMVLINEKNEKIGQLKALTDLESIKNRTRIDNPIFHPTILFRNEAELFYREKFYACEDFDFHLRKLSENRILHNLPESLVEYRVLEESISRKGNSFVKRLFLEQAKIFFIQREKFGKDSYETFDENEFLNILDPAYKNQKSSLIFAAQVAILYKRQDELNQILEKLRVQHHYSSMYFNLNRVRGFNKMISFAKRKLR